MFEWFSDFGVLLKVYWIIAIISGFFLIILIFYSSKSSLHQNKPAIIGQPTDKQLIFYIRIVFCFLLGYGWGGVCLYKMIESTILLNGLAVLTGVFFVSVFNYLTQYISRLPVDYSFHLHYAIGKVADVKREIPDEGFGKGKIQIRYWGNLYDVDAVAENYSIPQGAKVKILSISIADPKTVVVRIL